MSWSALRPFRARLPTEDPRGCSCVDRHRHRMSARQSGINVISDGTAAAASSNTARGMLVEISTA